MAKMETYRLGWRGAEYDIPMTATKRNEIDKLVAGLVTEAGENVKVIRTGEAHKIREWASANGYDIMGKRGRISQDIQDAYAAAMKKGSKSTAAKSSSAKAPAAPASPKANAGTSGDKPLSTKGAAAKAAVVEDEPEPAAA